MDLDQTVRIVIISDGKKVAPINLDKNNYDDIILWDAYKLLKKPEIREKYENEVGTITLSCLDAQIIVNCAGISKETTTFLTALFL